MRYFILPLILLGVAIGVIALTVADLVELARFENGRGVAPGTIEFEIRKPRKFTVWYHHRTEFEGHRFDLSENLPQNATFRVVNRDTDVVARMGGAMNSYKEMMDERAVAARVFRVNEPGRYQLDIGGVPPSVFSVAPVKLGAVLLDVAILVAVAGVTAIAFVIALVTWLKQRS